MNIDLPRHSLAQRRYYRGVVLPLFAIYWKVDDAEAHERLKGLCNQARSTGELTTVGFSQYLRRISQQAREYGFYLPAPTRRFYEQNDRQAFS